MDSLGGMFDFLTTGYEAAKSNIENVVLPYWSSTAQKAIEATVTKISDLTGWLSSANNNIAQANTIYQQLKSQGKATASDSAMYNNISKAQTDLANRLQDIGTQISNGQNTDSDYTVNISSNPSEPASSSTFNVTTDLLQGLGLIPVIAVAAVGVAVTGIIVYKIYELKTDSDQYLQYMQARAAAIKNGTPLPPLPPALAKYASSSWIAWLLSGIVLAGGIGTYIYIKHFRHKTVYQNPYGYKVFSKKREGHVLFPATSSALQRIHYGVGKITVRDKTEHGPFAVFETKEQAKNFLDRGYGDILYQVYYKPSKEQYLWKKLPPHFVKGYYGKYYAESSGSKQTAKENLPEGTVFADEVYVIPEETETEKHINPYSPRSIFTHHEIEPASHFIPSSIRTIKRGKYRFIVGSPKDKYTKHTGSRGGITRAIAELIPNPITQDLWSIKSKFENKLKLDRSLSAYGTIVDPNKAYKAAQSLTIPQINILSSWYEDRMKNYSSPAMAVANTMLNEVLIEKIKR